MILDLADERALEASSTGGKGSSLAALRSQGLPVPPGFVVTTRAFAAFLADSDLENELETLLEESPDSATAGETRAEEIQARIRASSVPAAVSEPLAAHLRELESQLPEGVRWAVRSSAVAEDLAGASFAGQYDSLLGVSGGREVERALLHCWASFFNPHAIRYRRDRGIRDLRAAVVVQRLVPADVAGVCFTLDPVSGDPDRIVVNANFGLGESVVSGRVDPDTFVVDKHSRCVTSRQIGAKALQIVPAPGGTQEIPVAEELRATASLSDEQVITVAGMAAEIESAQGRPVDIEWALLGGELYLLQSRPITAAGSPPAGAAREPPAGWAPELDTPIDPRYPLYSNGNISEVLPGCITPLSWSYIAPTIEHSFLAQGIALGSMQDSGREFQIMGFFYHRPYLCVSFLEAAMARTPGMSPDSVHEEFVGPPDSPTPAITARDLLPDRWPAIVRVVWTMLRQATRVERDAGECDALVRRQAETTTQEHLKSWSDAHLLEAVRFSKELAWVSDVHLWASGFAVLSFGLLRSLTRAWLADEDGVLAAQMVTGIGSLPSADPAFGIHRLARSVLADPELRARFEAVPNDAALHRELESDPGLARHAAALREFLASFGHRAVCEAEFRSPCWREDPAQVLALVRNYLQPGVTSPEEVRQRQEGIQIAAAAQARRLAWPRRAFLQGVLTKARRSIGLREQLKDLVVLRSDRARRIYAEIRDRLVARGDLADADDIYFLVGHEVADLVTGATTPDEAGRIVTRRRRDFARCEAVSVPKIQSGVPRLATPEDLPAHQKMSGIGVSPGIVQGRARVIRDPRTESHIEPGEILVAPVTDAGWTPLFINAAGLVVEVGGLLSHGSVVAREYGLPTVVGVAGATQLIATGDRIHLDGSTGVVLKLDERTKETSESFP